MKSSSGNNVQIILIRFGGLGGEGGIFTKLERLLVPYMADWDRLGRRS